MTTYCDKLVPWDDPTLYRMMTQKGKVIRPCFKCVLDNSDEWYCRDKELLRQKFREEDNNGEP